MPAGGGGTTFRTIRVPQSLGFNSGLSGAAGFARLHRDTGPVQSFYFDNVLVDGTIDASTGLPTSGNTKVTIQLRPGVTYPTGNYTMTWTGAGTVEGQSSPLTVVVDVADSVTLNVVGAIADVSFVPESSSGTYTDTFTSRAQRGDCIRFMEALRTNEDGGASAASYDPVNPYIRERIVSGANTFYHRTITPTVAGNLGKYFNTGVWWNAHHGASNQNVTDAVTDIRATGFTGDLYIEFSNEAWNSSFPQYGVLLQEAIDTEQYGGAPGDFARQQAYYADRVQAIGGIAKAVDPNVIVVIGGKTVTPNSYNNWHDYGLTAPFSNIDAVAVSWYFGGIPARGKTPAEGQALSASDMATLCRDDWEDTITPFLTTWKGYADTSGWDMLGYEGGSHLDHTDGTTQAHYTTLSQTPEVATVHGEAMDWWNTNIGGLALLFQSVGDPADPWSWHEGELGPDTYRWLEFLSRAS